jgi:hypothetical protein
LSPISLHAYTRKVELGERLQAGQMRDLGKGVKESGFGLRAPWEET